jgi:hypothetical protein
MGSKGAGSIRALTWTFGGTTHQRMYRHPPGISPTHNMWVYAILTQFRRDRNETDLIVSEPHLGGISSPAKSSTPAICLMRHRPESIAKHNAMFTSMPAKSRWPFPLFFDHWQLYP